VATSAQAESASRWAACRGAAGALAARRVMPCLLEVPGLEASPGVQNWPGSAEPPIEEMRPLSSSRSALPRHPVTTPEVALKRGFAPCSCPDADFGFGATSAEGNIPWADLKCPKIDDAEHELFVTSGQDDSIYPARAGQATAVKGNCSLFTHSSLKLGFTFFDLTVDSEDEDNGCDEAEVEDITSRHDDAIASSDPNNDEEDKTAETMFFHIGSDTEGIEELADSASDYASSRAEATPGCHETLKDEAWPCKLDFESQIDKIAILEAKIEGLYDSLASAELKIAALEAKQVLGLSLDSVIHDTEDGSCNTAVANMQGDLYSCELAINSLDEEGILPCGLASAFVAPYVKCTAEADEAKGAPHEKAAVVSKGKRRKGQKGKKLAEHPKEGNLSEAYEEERWTGIANMVAWRRTAGENKVTHFEACALRAAAGLCALDDVACAQDEFDGGLDFEGIWQVVVGADFQFSPKAGVAASASAGGWNGFVVERCFGKFGAWSFEGQVLGDLRRYLVCPSGNGLDSWSEEGRALHLLGEVGSAEVNGQCQGGAGVLGKDNCKKLDVICEETVLDPKAPAFFPGLLPEIIEICAKWTRAFESLPRGSSGRAELSSDMAAFVSGCPALAEWWLQQDLAE
jgi:hypothetical protein